MYEKQIKKQYHFAVLLFVATSASSAVAAVAKCAYSEQTDTFTEKVASPVPIPRTVSHPVPIP